MKRYYLTYKLLDGTSLNAVLETNSEKDAIVKTVKASQTCFEGDRKFTLTSSTPCTSEIWEDSRAVVQNGSCNCQVRALYPNDEIVTNKLFRLKGVKTAYNLILLSSPVKPKIVFIYDLNQRAQKQRASLRAKNVLKDSKKTQEILKQFTEKLQEIPGLGEYLQDIPLVCSMIIDYVKGIYREVPVATIIGLTAAILYFISPVDLIPDIIPIIGQVDDVGVLTWALKRAHGDIMKYKAWKYREKSTLKGGTSNDKR